MKYKRKLALGAEQIRELGTYQRPSADDKNKIKNITPSETKNPAVKDVIKAIWVNLSGIVCHFKKIKESLDGQLSDTSD